jgi:hypothetical protein
MASLTEHYRIRVGSGVREYKCLLCSQKWQSTRTRGASRRLASSSRLCEVLTHVRQCLKTAKPWAVVSETGRIQSRHATEQAAKNAAFELNSKNGPEHVDFNVRAPATPHLSKSRSPLTRTAGP